LEAIPRKSGGLRRQFRRIGLIGRPLSLSALTPHFVSSSAASIISAMPRSQKRQKIFAPAP
jgi:hypothetical protein